MFGVLREDGKANGEKPERRKERTLEHAGTQNQIPGNASKNFAQTQAINQSVMLSGALQRNAKHEARLSNISGYLLEMPDREPEILRFAQNDICEMGKILFSRYLCESRVTSK